MQALQLQSDVPVSTRVNVSIISVNLHARAGKVTLRFYNTMIPIRYPNTLRGHSEYELPRPEQITIFPDFNALGLRHRMT
jgi:hypothetical protein